MFRSPQPGDWAAEDDDDIEFPMPSSPSKGGSSSASASSGPRGADVFVPPPKPKPVKSAWGDPNKSSPPAAATLSSLEPTPAEAAAAPSQKTHPRKDEDAGSSPFFRDHPGPDRRNHPRERGERGGFDRSRSREEETNGNRWGNRDRQVRKDHDYDRNERFDHGKDKHTRGGGRDRFDRGGSSSDGFDREDRFARRGPPVRDSHDRFGRRGGNDREERFDGPRPDRFDRDGPRNDRFDRDGPRPARNERRRTTPPSPSPSPMSIERGIVISIKENFGFISCADREGDLFFHISEAPMDIQVKDEVEFKVKYNNRSQKEIACELVVLPKGTIVFEDVRT
jgi:cold shock CspA family protein